MPGLQWFTSSYSDQQGGNCVEVAAASDVVYVRDSKDREGPALAFSTGAWSEFASFAAATEV